MEIRLEPEVQEVVDRLVARSVYASAEEAVAATLRLNLDPPEMYRRRDELQCMIQAGLASAERGEWIDADEVFDEILREIDQAEPRSQ